MTDIELFKALEGLDAEGNGNAVFTASVRGLDENDNEYAIEEAGTDNADIRFSIVPNGISCIDVMFYDATEYDYLQLTSVCNHYTDYTDEALNSEDIVVPALTLSLMPVGDFEEFLVITEAQWTYYCPDPAKPPTGIRFIFLTDKMNHVTLSSEETDAAVLSALDEGA